MKNVKQMLNNSKGKPSVKARKSRNLKLKSGVPGGIRTHDPLLRRQPLYPTELQGHAVSY